ncbi:MAG: prepilin-type N-terminal cleavage/methylation domain-containing protein [Planctomycetes bacterium]|nr:prepilin-type N-terminal cleavage/methylation domain-containing protein [Planctomycetota bacterium]
MRRGLTLIEILVTTAIIALLAAILLPSLSAAKSQARRSLCMSNLKQLSLASAMYLDDQHDHFWRYYVNRPEGRYWWFGFEPGGPPANTVGQRYRPLVKTKGVLARYLRSTDNELQCPSFPYDSAGYFPKFASRSASYGYNLQLGPANLLRKTPRRSAFARRMASVFVFADGVHFDFNPGMNEGHYIDYVDVPSDPFAAGGFGHYRHNGRAAVLFMDGHVDCLRLTGAAYGGPVEGGPAGNVTGPGGGPEMYGF